MTIYKANGKAGSNIAFVKYWGNRDDGLRIPMNGSISMTLDAAHTVTAVEFSPEFEADTLILNEESAGELATQRAATHVDHLRKIAGVDLKCRIVSTNSFPTGAGIASSASGFAALTVAAAKALNLDLSHEELSRLARLGSGSASRSIDGGFVEWQPGTTHADSFAAPLAPPNHWDLVDIIAIVSQDEKDVGSSAGHPLAHTSPFYTARLVELETTLPAVRQAILDRDMGTFGEMIEAEAISLHVASMTSKPSILYWGPGTIAIMHALRRWRKEGGPIGYYTIDAGPNIHVIAERSQKDALVEALNTIPFIESLIVCGVGGPAEGMTE
ncbi:MAG: diphosphomevalonate decarboxylase [Chloroflexota bacterium]